ncbi:MAG: hypothetical protein RJB38_311 [Pseudomonadota bacterium]|jgi:diguanylate cyclase (GGDEF)-like protein
MTSVKPIDWTSVPTYADLFLRLLDPAFLLDGKTLEILAINDSVEKALGSPASELIGTSFIGKIPATMRNSFEQQVRVTLRRYHPREFETELGLAEEQTRLYRCGLCQLENKNPDDSRPLLQLIATDITAQREAEQRATRFLEELQALNRKLQDLSVTDEMTQIPNFRHFKECIDNEHSRAQRFNRPYSVLFFDIDNFKFFNDRNGHPAGDRLLKELAQLLKGTSRETDMVARYGGEEFVILATETDAQQGRDFAERVRKIIVATPFEHGESQPLGVLSTSIGVATFPGDGQTPSEVIHAADQAMYHSKKSGKNRVTLFRDLPRSE